MRRGILAYIYSLSLPRQRHQSKDHQYKDLNSLFISHQKKYLYLKDFILATSILNFANILKAMCF